MLKSSNLFKAINFRTCRSNKKIQEVPIHIPISAFANFNFPNAFFPFAPTQLYSLANLLIIICDKLRLIQSYADVPPIFIMKCICKGKNNQKYEKINDKF